MRAPRSPFVPRRRAGTLLWLEAIRQLERRDAGAPVERAARLQVLARVVERAVVDGVHRDRAVVAPPREVAELRPATLDDGRLGLQGPQRIGRGAHGVADRGVDAAARRAV